VKAHWAGVAAAVILGAGPARAEVKVAALIGDHMVVQRGRPVHVWGTAAPGEKVTASLAGRTARAEADAAGAFSLRLPALAAGGPHTLTVRGRNTLTFTGVWVGEVWVGSGQSNMEFPLIRATSAAEAATGCASLHLFTVPRETAAEPRPDVEGAWSACDEAGASAFSAVAFHFGQELHAALGVHVGLIHASWGGTPAEAWTPRAALAAVPAFRPMVEKFDAALRDPRPRAEAARELAAWEARVFPQDTENAGLGQGFAAPDADVSAWKPMELPQYWETAGLLLDGALWFRREVTLPAEAAGRDLTLTLGSIDDFDTTYWNGERVGATGVETPQYYVAPRRYTVPGRLVKAGRNVVAVRVFDHYGNGGFGGAASQMKVAVAGGGADPLPLSGPWLYRVERGLPPAVVDFSTQPQPVGVNNPGSPTVLWNGMAHALTPAPIAGVIWYQGEANASRAFQYRTLFPAMIEAWRSAWKQPDLPFLFVQLANYMPPPAQPGESEWAELREAQAKTDLEVPHTGMAVILDIGEASDIHPRNKKDVGHRLALLALKDVYGRGGIASGPTYAAAATEGGAIRVRFDDHGGGLTTSDGQPPRGFAIAGSDHRWVWAEARIEGDAVVVSSPQVPRPAAVRYGWADNPQSTLRGRHGLPAAPFRTDAWPGLTGPR
jgi:sialate O-acetylesterase